MPALLLQGRKGITLPILALPLPRFLVLAAIVLAVAPPRTHPLVSPARADVPVENIRFDNGDLHSTAIEAAKAVNNCDPNRAPKLIQELKDTQRAPAGLGPADILRLPDLIKLLESDYAARCGRHHLPGGPNGATYAFHVKTTLDQFAKPQLDRALKACSEAEFDAALAELERIAQIADANGNNTANPQHKRAYQEDAKSLRRIAADLSADKKKIIDQNQRTDPRCKGSTEPSSTTPGGQPKPGTSGPGAPSVDPEPRASPTPPEFGQRTTPNNLHNLAMTMSEFRFGGGFFGGHVSVPSVGAGTLFDATLGRERQILFTPRNVTIAGGVAEFEAPVSRLFGANGTSIFSEVAFYAQLKGYSLSGSNGATVPIGGQNVAYTYLFPNPTTGTTGVLAGASGQTINVKINGEALQLAVGLKWPGPKLSQIPQITTSFGLGAAYEYWDMGHEISQQSLAFPNVSSRTKLRIDEHFFAATLSAGVRLDDGVFFGSLTGFVAPGFVITDASAKQKNLCGPCGNPGDRNFKLSRNFGETRFSLKTGFNVALGVRVTQSVSVQAGMKFVHTSESGYLRPPTTPNEQPVRLDFGARNLLGGNVMLLYRF